MASIASGEVLRTIAVRTGSPRVSLRLARCCEYRVAQGGRSTAGASAWRGCMPLRTVPHIPRVCLARNAAEHRVHQVAVGVDRPGQGAPGAVCFDAGLVRVPSRAGLAFPPCPQVLGQERRRVPACGCGLPAAHRLMAEGEPPLQGHLRQVAQAQRGARPPRDDQEHDVLGDAQVAGGGAAPLVAAARAGWAAEGPVAQAGPLDLLPGAGQPAV